MENIASLKKNRHRPPLVQGGWGANPPNPACHQSISISIGSLPHICIGNAHKFVPLEDSLEMKIVLFFFRWKAAEIVQWKNQEHSNVSVDFNFSWTIQWHNNNTCATSFTALPKRKWLLQFYVDTKLEI